MKTFKTKAGTELPMMDLKGKDYLQVAWRLVWFREEKPGWTIETESCFSIGFDKKEPGTPSATFKATIKDEAGKVIQTGHGSEDQKGFPDYLEKAETKAVGRALAMLGYGTQFAPELEEGERLADSPLARNKPFSGSSIAPKIHAKSMQPGPNDGAPSVSAMLANITQDIPPAAQELAPFDFEGISGAPAKPLGHYCSCGAEMVKSKTKNLLYCPEFKNTKVNHSKNIPCQGNAYQS